jgi:hypothetical protein
VVTANLNSDWTDETRDDPTQPGPSQDTHAQADTSDPTPDGASVFGVACYVTVSPEGHFVNQISASK